MSQKVSHECQASKCGWFGENEVRMNCNRRLISVGMPWKLYLIQSAMMGAFNTLNSYFVNHLEH